MFSIPAGLVGTHHEERIAGRTCGAGDILLALTIVGNHEKIGAMSHRGKKKSFIC